VCNRRAGSVVVTVAVLTLGRPVQASSVWIAPSMVLMTMDKSPLSRSLSLTSGPATAPNVGVDGRPCPGVQVEVEHGRGRGTRHTGHHYTGAIIQSSCNGCRTRRFQCAVPVLVPRATGAPPHAHAQSPTHSHRVRMRLVLTLVEPPPRRVPRPAMDLRTGRQPVVTVSDDTAKHA
jgi:hypothetical protein